MITQKKIQLSEQDLQQYRQIEDSIKYWSMEHTKAVIQARRLETSVEGMYQGRMQFMNGVLSNVSIDPSHVHNVNVNTDTGEVTVSVDESVPNPAADSE